MTALDWALLLVLLLAAAGGTTQGFLASALGFVGFTGGALLGARLGPLVLPEKIDDVNAPIAAIFGATLLGIVLGVALQRLGDRIHHRLRSRPGVALRTADAALGALFTAALVVLAAWFLSAMVLQTPGVPGSWRSQVRESALLRELRRELPPADDALALLSRFDPLPGFAGPRALVDAPDQGIVDVPGVRTGRRGVVRVEGSACGVGIVGTGWVARPGYVVTNQHVIAGEDDTTVVSAVDGQRYSAEVVAVNRDQDIAVLAVDGLDMRPLRTVEDPPSGSSVAILGYPLAGPFRSRAARIGRAQTVTGQDSYGAGPVRRRVLPFRGLVEQGNSGGPLVDRRGRVVGTVFASSTQEGQRRGYAVPNDVVDAAVAAADRTRPVDPGPCSH